MSKVSRKDFVKTQELAELTGKSYAEFVDHSKRIHVYLLKEIEKLQERVKQLEPKVESQEPPVS